MRYGLWIVAGAWLLYGVLNAVLVHYRSALYGKEVPWGEALLYEVPYTLIWAAVTPAVLRLASRYPLNGPRVFLHGLVHLVGALVTATITKVVWDFTMLPQLSPSTLPVDTTTLVRSVLHSLDFGVLQYTIVVAAHHAWEMHRRYEDGRLRASQLEARLATAQLQALKMQLQPHFLFNTLHSISELIHADPARAERMLMRLSEFLRLTLEQAAAPDVRLNEELDFLRRYLEIEQMRFEDRLRVDWNIAEETLPARVPNLILQPLVENALKHGIARIAGPGLLRISCQREGEQLCLEVYDNGPGPESGREHPPREGVGLNNTRHRLEHLYAGNHRLDLKRVPLGGFAVTIRIPFRPIVPAL